MEINWYTISWITFIAIAFVVFLIKKNNSDKKKLETFLNNEDEKEDIEEDEVNNPN